MLVDYEHLVSKNVSQRPSYELLQLHIVANLSGKKMSVETGITAPFLNACPCAQRWAMREYATALKKQGYAPKEIEALIKIAPLQTHTNRGKATLMIHSDRVMFPDLYHIVEQSSPILRELVSGEDEHLFLKEVHRKGYFFEDVTRAIMANTVKNLGHKVPPSTLVEITVDVEESMHSKNFLSTVKKTMGELRG